MMRGWMKWEGGTRRRCRDGLRARRFPVKHRYALGDLDESTGRGCPTARPRSLGAKLPRLADRGSPPHGDLTFSGSSYGIELALKEICRVYSAEAHSIPTLIPS